MAAQQRLGYAQEKWNPGGTPARVPQVGRQEIAELSGLFLTVYRGAQGRNRTVDPVIFSHVLYQLSYLGGEAGMPPRAVVSSS